MRKGIVIFSECLVLLNQQILYDMGPLTLVRWLLQMYFITVLIFNLLLREGLKIEKNSGIFQEKIFEKLDLVGSGRMAKSSSNGKDICFLFFRMIFHHSRSIGSISQCSNKPGNLSISAAEIYLPLLLFHERCSRGFCKM